MATQDARLAIALRPIALSLRVPAGPQLEHRHQGGTLRERAERLLRRRHEHRTWSAHAAHRGVCGAHRSAVARVALARRQRRWRVHPARPHPARRLLPPHTHGGGHMSAACRPSNLTTSTPLRPARRACRGDAAELPRPRRRPFAPPTPNPDPNPNTDHSLYLTVEIPDVACERCALHLSNPMW